MPNLAGEQHPNATLSALAVAEIRNIYARSKGAKYVRRGTRLALAKQFGVTLSAIKHIVGGRTWRYPPTDYPFHPPPD